MLIEEEANIRAKLTNIQASLTPHMEILHKELGYAKKLLKKDPNLSTLDGLVLLASKLTIQLKSLEVTCSSKNNNGSPQNLFGKIHNQCIAHLT